MTRHLTSEEISRSIAGEPVAETQRHLLECPRCAAEFAHFEDAIALFRESGRQWSQHCYESQRQPAAVPRVRRPLLLSAAGLAACVLVAGLLHGPAPVGPAPRAPETRTEDAFLPLPFVAPMAPYERASIMRMDVPVAALIAAGFEVHIPDVGASVRADVLFGQDGRAHAIRLVSDSLINSERRINQ